MKYIALLLMAQIFANAVAAAEYDDPENLKLIEDYQAYVYHGIAVETGLLAKGCIESFGKDLAEKSECVQYIEDYKKYHARLADLTNKVDSVEVGYFQRVEDAKASKDYKKLENILREKEAFEPIYYQIHGLRYDWSWHIDLEDIRESRGFLRIIETYLNLAPNAENPDIPYSNPKYKELVMKAVDAMPGY